MKNFKSFLEEQGRCWTGYKPVKGKKAFSPDSCEKIKEEGEGAPANNVGSGNIAGTGGKAGEPGVTKKRNPVLVTLSRNKPRV